MGLIYYLLEANLYLFMFYAFYRALLHKETFYALNRYYLLIASFTAFLLPLMQSGYFTAAREATIQNQIRLSGNLLIKNAAGLKLTAVDQPINYLDLLPYLYIAITAVFLTKLAISLLSIYKMVRKSATEKAGKVTYITLKDNEEKAFSFFNLLFINPKIEEKNTVISHELVHINQKHSVDIMFFEVLNAVCWFNPIAYFIKNDAKLVHEYLADECTINFTNNKHEYAMFLIRNSFGIPANELTNHIFNQSILKRRINMLNKKRTTGKTKYRLLLLLPLGATMLCISTMAFTKTYGFIDLYPEKYSAIKNMEQVKAPQIPPPPMEIEKMSNGKYKYTRSFIYVKSSKKTSPISNYLIVINGKETSMDGINVISNADKMNVLSGAEGIKKYGERAKNGVLEVTGSSITFMKAPLAPPPPIDNPRGKLMKVPPPIVTNNDAHNYFNDVRYNKATKKNYRADARLIILNGKEFDYNANDNKYAVGFKNADIIYLLSDEAVKKYGDKAKAGAVEISGNDVQLVYLPPPPVQRDFVKFPPPVVKPDKKAVKKDVVRFPPAVVAPDKKVVKKDRIKFPPATVKPDTLKKN